MTGVGERLAAVRARQDQLNALIAEISNDPLALAAFADRLVREHLDRELEEISAELAAIEAEA